MVVDSSALVAIFHVESEAAAFTRAIVLSPEPVAIAGPSLLETSIVLERAGGRAIVADLDRFIHVSRIEIAPFGLDLIEVAREAFRRFGRGTGHPARLNFGDCFSYALAAHRNVPLLFKGEDFSLTDIRRAAVPPVEHAAGTDQ